MRYGFLLCLFISGFAHAGTLSITSNPTESDVFVVDSKTGERSRLGTTPFEGPVSDVLERSSDGNSLFVELEKPGFEKYRVFLASFGKSDIDFKINLEVAKDMRMVQDMDFLMSDLFDVQRMIRGQDFSSALEKLDLLKDRFPHFSILEELRGSVFYLTQEYTRALTAYRRAFALNAKNRDVYRMMIYLERRFNLSDSEQVMTER